MAAMMRVNRRRRATAKSFPAPVGGWDASSELADMPPDRAIELVNLFPEEGRVSVRGGHRPYATGMGSQAVESLLVWSGPASSKMFAAHNGGIYDASDSGAVGAAEVSSLSGNRWQYENIATAGGNFLFAVNGADDARTYDGTTWATASITGVASSDLIGVCLHKRRLFFVEQDTSDAWYLPVESIGGTASRLPLGPYFSRGGALQAIGTWTIDGGAGPDDYIAFVSSEGDVAVYAGTDPSSASTWSLVGVYVIGEPIGRRCIQKFGADLAILTTDGIISLTAMARLDRTQADNASVSTLIRDAFKPVTRSYGSNFGWELVTYPGGRMAFANVPIIEGTTQDQYVMNSLTGAWCLFKGLDANCWAVFNRGLYFGGNAGSVYQADTGTDDDGADIAWRCRWAYNYFGSRGRMKHLHLMRPIIESNGTLQPAVTVNLDYKTTEPSQVATFIGTGDDDWDVALWDEALWGGDDQTQLKWLSIGGVGHALSAHMKGAVQRATCRIIGFDVTYSMGGIV